VVAFTLGPARYRPLGGVSGMVYMLIMPAQTIQGTLRGRARRKLEQRLAAERGTVGRAAESSVVTGEPVGAS